MTISHGMKNEHLFAKILLLPPGSLCPLVKLDESILS